MQNGNFESGGADMPNGWSSVWPTALLKVAPRFELSREAPHGGERCARLVVEEAGGYCSFTQEVAAVPRKARSARLEGWIRFEPSGGAPGSPSLMVLMYESGKVDSSRVFEARWPAGTSGWQHVAVEASVPEGATAWMVRCGMTGVGTACFDDVSLTASEEAIEQTELFVVHGDYSLAETSSTEDPWIDVPIPFPFETQTPLALRVDTTPARRARSLEVVAERENRHLRVHLEPSGRDASTELRVEVLVLVRDLPRGDAKGVKLANENKLPKEVALYFDETPGIEVDAAGIQAVAKELEATTLDRAIDGVLDWMRANFEYAGGGDQGAKASFERKSAVCTGHANLAAALFQAAGVPCRILGCVMGERLQQHYIVEVWGPKVGWLRVESTAELFPISDSMHVILHVAHPQFPRSPGNVPLFLAGEPNCSASQRLGEDHCWQGMRSVGSHGLAPGEAVKLEKAARDAFAAWERTPAIGASIRFLQLPAKPGAWSERAAPILAELERFLARQ